MDLATRLKQLRIDERLSQMDVADAVKISRCIISQYESGQRTPSLEKLIRLSHFYGVSIDYLVGSVDSPTEMLRK